MFGPRFKKIKAICVGGNNYYYMSIELKFDYIAASSCSQLFPDEFSNTRWGLVLKIWKVKHESWKSVIYLVIKVTKLYTFTITVNIFSQDCNLYNKLTLSKKLKDQIYTSKDYLNY